MTRQRKHLIGAAIAIVVVGWLVYAGVPVSTLVVIGLAVAMAFVHAGGHGGHGGFGGGPETSGHEQSSGTTDPSHMRDDAARR